MLRCADGSFYTGIALDVDRRIEEHESGIRGAKYLRGRTPLELVFQLAVGDRAAAQRLEHRVKRLSRTEKQALIDGDLSLLQPVDARAFQASGVCSGYSTSGSPNTGK